MSVLARAELLLQAKNYSGSGDWLDESGNGHHAQLGSTSGADTNDPLFLPYDGEKHLYHPGGTQDARIPSDASLDPVEDMELRFDVTADDWTPATATYLAGRYTTTGNNRVWRAYVETDGSLRLQTEDGSGGLRGIVFDEVLPALTAGQRVHLRLVLDADNGGGNTNVTGYHRTDTSLDLDDDSGWTSLGTNGTAGVQGWKATPSADLSLGSSFEGNNPWIGKQYRMMYWVDGDASTGTLAVDARYADATEPYASFTEASANAATVTLNRFATGRKLTVVDQDLFLLGTDDYFEIPDDLGLDFAGDEDLTVMVAARHYDVSPPSDSVLVFKKDDLTTSAGYGLYVEAADDTAKFLIADGTADDEDASPNLTAGTRFTLVGVRNTSDDDIEAFTDGTGSGSPVTDSTTATLANALPLRLGATSGTAANFFDGEIHATILWREALTDAEIAQAGEELLLLFPDAPAHRRRRKYLLRTRGRAR